MPKMTLLLNLYLATGRERRERGNGSNTLGMRAPGTKPCGFFFFFFKLCLPGQLKVCLLILSYSICLLWIFVFNLKRERCV